jgi:hypothetical protein
MAQGVEQDSLIVAGLAARAHQGASNHSSNEFRRVSSM